MRAAQDEARSRRLALRLGRTERAMQLGDAGDVKDCNDRVIVALATAHSEGRAQGAAVGAAVGLALGALLMHLHTKGKR